MRLLLICQLSDGFLNILIGNFGGEGKEGREEGGVMAEIIKSVTTEQMIKIVFTAGDGTPSDPVRLICQYWDMDGNLIKEKDSYTE